MQKREISVIIVWYGFVSNIPDKKRFAITLEREGARFSDQNCPEGKIMAQIAKKTPFFTGSFFREATRYALPIMLQNLLVSSLAMVDTLMVGQLGEVDVAAVGMAAQIAFLLNICVFGICSAGTVFISQFWGSGNQKGVSRTYGLMLVGCVLISGVFCGVIALFPEQAIRLYTEKDIVAKAGAEYIRVACFSYVGVAVNLCFTNVLRAVGKPLLPLISSFLSVSTNVFFNWVLIFGELGFPELGLVGAAWGSVIASVVSPVFTFLCSLVAKNELASHPGDIFRISRAFLWQFIRVGAPVFFNEMFWALGMTGYNMIFGRMGTDDYNYNYSALTIARTVEDIMYVMYIGLCNACAVMVGRSVGSGETEQAKQDAKRFLLLVPLVGFVLGMAVIALRGPILSLFDVADEVRRIAELLLIMYGFEISLRNIPYVCIVGIFRAGGDTTHGMVYDLGTIWLFALPITAVLGLVFQLPFPLVYLIMLLAEDILKSALCLIHFFRMKWIRPVEEKSPQPSPCELET